MHQLYPTLLRMPVVVRVEGRAEEYVISVLAYACKDELKQVVEDGMLISNRNFDKTAGRASMFTTTMYCSSIISELLPYSNAFFYRPLL